MVIRRLIKEQYGTVCKSMEDFADSYCSSESDFERLRTDESTKNFLQNVNLSEGQFNILWNHYAECCGEARR